VTDIVSTSIGAPDGEVRRPDERPPHRISPGQIWAVTAGNALEFYDFVTYSFFAAQIGQCFFPSADPASSLLASLATFGAGFLTRPIGALVIGRFADRVGRKPAMLLSFSLMGAAIVGLALTPSRAAVGIAAPVLAVLFRLLQGFALGGEVGPSTAFLVEAAPPSRRGFYVSLQSMSQDFAVLVAGLMGVGLSSLLGPEALRDWGWRIALLLGAAIVPFGLALRRRLVETLDAQSEADARPNAPAPTPAVRRQAARIFILALMMLAGGTTVGYVLDYLTTYAATTLHMPARLAFGATVVLGITSVIFDPVGGWLSDRFGRRTVMILPWSLLAVLITPAFYLASHVRQAWGLFLAVAVMSILQAIATASMLTAIAESLPRRARSAGFALVYALAIAVFGGSAQFNVAWLTRVTHSPLAPGWYMVAGVVLGLAGMLAMRETAPVRPSGRVT
jgi:MHS family citrate/tricarballylate:H+ symporter-like MFS transporter